MLHEESRDPESEQGNDALFPLDPIIDAIPSLEELGASDLEEAEEGTVPPAALLKPAQDDLAEEPSSEDKKPEEEREPLQSAGKIGMDINEDSDEDSDEEDDEESKDDRNRDEGLNGDSDGDSAKESEEIPGGHGKVPQRAAPSRNNDLPESYNEDILVFLVRDPFMAFAYWDLSLQRKELIYQLPELEVPQGQLFLKVYKGLNRAELLRDPQIHAELPITGLTRSCYFAIDEGFDAYCGAIEFVPFFDEPLTIARSNTITPPKASMSGELDEEWKAIERIYKRFYQLVKREQTQDQQIKEMITKEELEEIELLQDLDREEKIEKVMLETVSAEQEEKGSLQKEVYEASALREPLAWEEVPAEREAQKELDALESLESLSEREIESHIERIAAETGIAKETLVAIRERRHERTEKRAQILRRLVALYIQKQTPSGGIYGPIFPHGAPPPLPDEKP
ncbi:MAG: DUF4912 domain-containing protein [Candidatus Eremiobacteraeota bacterium]|nr:DUF4912 domain-containing protein [Candidatus Eremiobacteraeota bacterium]